MSKILYFTPYNFVGKTFLSKLKTYLDTTPPEVTTTLSSSVFEKKVRQIGPWDMIVIELNTEYFIEKKLSYIKEYIEGLRNLPIKPGIVITLTSDEYLKKFLIKNGIKVVDVGGKAKIKEERNILQKKISIESVGRIVCPFFNVTYEETLEKTNKRKITLPRQVSIYFAILYSGKSLKSIGQHYGKKDHSVPVHSRERVKDLIDSDLLLKEKINMIDVLLEKSII